MVGDGSFSWSSYAFGFYIYPITGRSARGGVCEFERSGTGRASSIRKKTFGKAAPGGRTCLEMNIRSILFPVDFSERCTAVIPHVEAAARRFGAGVILLHIVEPFVAPYGLMETFVYEGLEPSNLKERAEAMLTWFGARGFAGLNVEKVVDAGDPGSRIASFARDRNIDLIMMTTRGRGPFRAALLGSVTAKVLHDAECPVWTAAHVELLAPDRHLDWQNVICAVDLSAEAAHLLLAAEDLRNTTGATVRVLHVVPGEEALPQRLWNAEFEFDLKQQARKALQNLQSGTGTSFQSCVGAGTPSHVIAERAREWDADLVLAGRGPAGGARLRSHTYSIVRDTSCPVLSI
jgi:nucleotide-binding universal stress UspA family protein